MNNRLNETRKIHDLKNNMIIWCKVGVTLVACSMNYSMVKDEVEQQSYEKIYSKLPELSKVFLSMDTDIIKIFILMFFLLKFYQYSNVNISERRRKISCVLLAIIASVSLLVGNAITKYNGVELLITGMVQIIKSGIVLAGYLLFFYHLVAIGITRYDEYMKCDEELQSTFWKRKNICFIIFGALILSWLPVLYTYYPAMFMGDTEDIVYMAFNYPTGVAYTVDRPVEGVWITNHHPVIYTVLVGSVLKFVKLFGGSDNLGIFLCSLGQCIMTAAVLAYSIVYCARDLRKQKIAMGAILFYIFCPWISKFVIMISKDAIFANFILLFGIELHKGLRTPEKKKTVISIILTGMLVLLFRKNGLYIVLLTLIVVLTMYRKHWKKWLLCIAVIVAFHIGYSNIMLPALGIADGSVREMLSIPFQQTARYVQMHGEEVTEREREVIDEILIYDELATLYEPNISDPVKGTYRVESDTQDLVNYIRVWFSMLWKHPETYVAATLNNYYGYVYPIVNDIHKIYDKSIGSIENVNRDGYFRFHNIYDNIHIWLRDICSFWDMLCMRIPVVNILMTSAFYVWIIIWGCFVKFFRQDKIGFVFAFMYLMLVFTALVGPCNAIDYPRYIYPCILGMPIIIGLLMQER